MSILPVQNDSGVCPHCYHDVYFCEARNEELDNASLYARTDEDEIKIWKVKCPNCRKVIICIDSPFWIGTIYPMGSNRPPIPQEVQDELIKKDYREACFIILSSPVAAGALARRCLSRMLVKEYNAAEEAPLHVQVRNVEGKIKDDKLIEDLDYVVKICRFAQFAEEGYRHDELIPVTYEEVDATLTIIEELFDELYVQPVKRQSRWNKLKEKTGT